LDFGPKLLKMLLKSPDHQLVITANQIATKAKTFTVLIEIFWIFCFIS